MDIQAATARARRTFAYRDDDDGANNPDSDSDSAMALDEQEQESLIASLAAQNAARNAQFRLFLLLLPAFSALPYLLALFRGPGAVMVVPVLGLSSLACTAWTLLALPPGITGIAALDAWVSGDNSSHNNFNNSNNTLLQQQRLIRPSPLETYLPYLNAALCAVLILLELAGGGGGGGRSAETETAQQPWGHVALGNLPAIVYVVVLAAKAVMGGVDPERELGALRYEYKGA